MEDKKSKEAEEKIYGHVFQDPSHGPCHKHRPPFRRQSPWHFLKLGSNVLVLRGAFGKICLDFKEGLSREIARPAVFFLKKSRSLRN